MSQWDRRASFSKEKNLKLQEKEASKAKEEINIIQRGWDNPVGISPSG
jgi:hypothetical protein